MHPDTCSLIAYLDGELNEPLRLRITAHLEDCPDCRAEADDIESDRDWFVVLDAASLPLEAPPMCEGIERLRASMRQWLDQHPEAVLVPAANGSPERTANGLDADSLAAAFLGGRAPSLLG